MVNFHDLNLKKRPINKAKRGARVKAYKSCRCLQGHTHDSRGEADWCNKLEIRKKGGDIQDYQLQKTFPLEVNGHKICGHRPDFLVTGPDGIQWIEEYKGFATEIWRIKKKLFEALYPDLKYIVIDHNRNSTRRF